MSTCAFHDQSELRAISRDIRVFSGRAGNDENDGSDPVDIINVDRNAGRLLQCFYTFLSNASHHLAESD